MTPRSELDFLAALELDGEHGPASARSEREESLLLRGALDRAAGLHVLPVAPRRIPRLAWAAAALLAVSASASAAVWWYGTQPEPAPAVSTPQHRVLQPPRALPPREAALPEVVPEPAKTAPRIAPRTVRPPAETSPETERAAHDLLAEANTLRTQRAYGEASKRYARAAETAPHSLTAHAARVAQADLALEIEQRPAEARTLYEAALRAHPRGPLALEARYGIARCLRALGELRAETDALEKITADAPDTRVGRAAVKRLEELRARGQ